MRYIEYDAKVFKVTNKNYKKMIERVVQYGRVSIFNYGKLICYLDHNSFELMDRKEAKRRLKRL